MSATKKWIMDVEENFWDKVSVIIKESDDISEAMIQAVELGKKEVPFIHVDTVQESVTDMWTEIWSEHYA